MTFVKNTQNRSGEAGFTLVELAIVMIIIGLLIGGVLKGQELIANAQVAAAVTEIKGIDTAVSTFRDTHNAFPGDMSNATTRLPNCTGGGSTTCGNGNGNGRLDTSFDVAPSITDEGVRFWAQLNAADLFAGVSNVPTLTWGDALPAAAVGGGYHAASYLSTAAKLPNATGDAGTTRAGTYISLQSSPNTISSPATTTLPASIAAKIDRKMDDGGPNSGTVVAMGAVGPTACASSSTNSGIYQERENNIACGLYFRIQQ